MCIVTTAERLSIRTFLSFVFVYALLLAASAGPGRHALLALSRAADIVDSEE